LAIETSLSSRVVDDRRLARMPRKMLRKTLTRLRAGRGQEAGQKVEMANYDKSDKIHKGTIQ
jgi:hypothetical protein